MNSKGRCFFIGLDGADWKLLDLIISKGFLPNLARLRKKYSSGILNSTIPPLTAPAWSSFLTGTNPGEHGIYFWQERWHENSKRRLLTNSDIKVSQLPEILNKMGKSVGLLNCPFTYPVRDIDGYIVSGMLSPSLDKRSVYPESLVTELKSLDYITNIGVTSKNQGLVKLESLIPNLVRMSKKRTKTFQYLDSKYRTDFAGIVYISIDRIQHLAYGLIEDYLTGSSLNKNENEIAKKCLEVYLEVDRGVGKIFRMVGDRDMLLIASDHGFRKANRWLNLNLIFKNSGLIKISPYWVALSSVYSFFSKLGLNSFVRDKGLEVLHFLKNIGKRSNSSEFADSVEQSQSFKGSIDYSCSKLVVGESGEQGIYLLDNSIKDRVKDILINLVDDRLGTKPIKKVYFKESLYSGRALDKAPEVLVDLAEPYQIKSSKLMTGSVFEDNSWPYGGYHRREGVWLSNYNKIEGINNIEQLLGVIKDFYDRYN